MNIKEYIVSPSLIKIASNVSFIHHFSFGRDLSHGLFEVEGRELEFKFVVERDIGKHKEFDEKFEFYLGKKNCSEILYERPIPLRQTAKMLVKFKKSGIEMIVNKAYYNIVKFKIENIYPPGIHLDDLITTELLKHELSPISCSCISKNGKCYLIAAPPDTGKSLTCFLATKRGYSFISEDIAIIDKNYAYSVLTDTFLHFLHENKILPRVYKAFIRETPIAYFLKPPKVNFKKIFKNTKFEKKSRIEKIFILEKGEKGMQELNKEEMFRKLLLMNRNKFSYFNNPLLMAYSYFNPTFDLSALMKKEEELLKTIVYKCDGFIVRSNNAKDYIDFIENVSS